MTLKTFWEIIKETFRDFSEDKAARLAAALSYYTIFSLAPLLVIVVGIAGLLISATEVEAAIIQQVQGLAGQQTAQMVSEMLANFNRPGGGIITVVVGVVTLLIGATGVFGQLQDALNTIWEVEPKPNRGILGIIKDRFLSFTMILGLSFMLMVSLVVSAGLTAVGTFFGNLIPLGEWFWQILNQLISIGVITILFALIFQILPDVDIAWKDVWVGALVTSILFNIGKFALGYYLGNSAVTSGYGAAGSIIVILLWVYYTAQILFLGAEFTQVYARRFGSKIAPSTNATQISEGDRANQGMGPKKSGKDGAQQQPGPVAGSLQDAVMPVVDQPQVRVGQEHSSFMPVTGTGQPPRERIRYEPPDPSSVLPVIALGATASAVTLVKIVQAIANRLQSRPRTKKRWY
jgi:membrane protein